MIALQNKYYSGHYRTIEDGAAEEHLEETVGKELQTTGFKNSWRWQHKTKLDGDQCFVANVSLRATRHKSSCHLT